MQSRFLSVGVVSVLVAALATAVAPARAQAKPEKTESDKTYVTVTGDNDFFAGYDHHYTNGLQFAFSADRVELPGFLNALPTLRDGTDRRLTLAIGQRIYTPTDKKRSNPDPLDRPYAGWLYALAEARTRHGAAVDSLQASLGVIGPAALGRQTQNTYHGLIGSEKAQGWDKQLDNQLAVLLGYERAWPGVVTTRVGSLTADVTPKVGATVGNVYTYANAGGVLRLGRNLPDDFSATAVTLGPPRDGYRPTGSELGWYVWVGTDVRAVGFNTFIEGDLFGSGTGLKRETFGHDLQFGYTAVWGKSRLGVTFVRRSKEFETQSGADKFGQITYSFAV
jgi:lipid A 3-O-deacylase